MKSKRFPKPGDFIVVARDHDNLVAGSMIRCTNAVNGQPGRFQGELVSAPEGSPYEVGQMLNFRKNFCEPATREKRAELLEKKMADIKKKAQELLDEADEIQRQVKILREFESDAEAVADALGKIWGQSIPHEKKLKLIAGVVEEVF